MFLDQMKAAFPEHEIPSFLMVEANENSEKYKHDIRIYRKIAREIKNVKSEEKLNKKIKASVNAEMAKHQIALRPGNYDTLSEYFRLCFFLKVPKSRSNYCTLCISPQIKDGLHCGIREEAHDSIYAFYHGCTRTSQKDNQVRKNHFIRNVQNVILGSNLLGNGSFMARKNKLGI